MTRLRHLRRQARLAWHVFRGRPLAYRVRVHGALELIEDHSQALQVEVVTGGAPSGPFLISGSHCLMAWCTSWSAPKVDPNPPRRFGRPGGVDVNWFDSMASDVGTSTPIGPFTTGDHGEAP